MTSRFSHSVGILCVMQDHGVTGSTSTADGCHPMSADSTSSKQ